MVERGAASTHKIDVDAETIKALLDVAHHYEKVMGLARHIVVATSPSRIRRRYRYILQESQRLEDLAHAWLRIADQQQGPITIEMSLPEQVAFWGRLLSNLRTKRSRRRLSKEQVRDQELACAIIRDSVADSWSNDKMATERELMSRRRRERDWMLAELTK